jgi:hypothetical protein
MKINDVDTAVSWLIDRGYNHIMAEKWGEELVAYADWLQQEEKKSLEERKTEFIESIRPYLDEMGREAANSFAKHWLQIPPKGRKYKFEKEDTWNINLRIKTWMRNKRAFTAAGILEKKYAREKED